MPEIIDIRNILMPMWYAHPPAPLARQLILGDYASGRLSSDPLGLNLHGAVM